MPCRDYEADQSDARANVKRLDDLSSMLCDTCGKLEAAGFTHHLRDDTRIWWELHKKMDALRIAQEQALAKKTQDRLSAISKLTPDERKALGV